MTMTRIDGDVFEATCDPIEVTSISRPDPSWKETDANGHVHQWYVEGGGPDGSHIAATSYSPLTRYITPTLVWVKYGVGYYEDGSEYEIGHYECAQCRERVRSPGLTADTNRVYIPGRRYAINGQPVSEDEFRRRVESLKP